MKRWKYKIKFRERKQNLIYINCNQSFTVKLYRTYATKQYTLNLYTWKLYIQLLISLYNYIKYLKYKHTFIHTYMYTSIALIFYTRFTAIHPRPHPHPIHQNSLLSEHTPADTKTRRRIRPPEFTFTLWKKFVICFVFFFGFF